MKNFYRLDSTRVTYREYWWGTRSPLVLLAWLIRLLRIPLPGSTDDPTVETVGPYEIEEAALSEEVRARFLPLVEELKHRGFHSPVYHAIQVDFTSTEIYWATFCHVSGRVMGRIHHRIWKQPRRPKEHLFPVFITQFQDGGFLTSSGGKLDMLAPETCLARYYPGKSATEVWQAHEMDLESQRDRAIVPVTPTQLRERIEEYHGVLRDFHLDRGVFVPFTAPEQQAIAAAAPETPVGEAPVQYADVLVELERLQTAKSSWRSGLLVLAISVAAFIGAAQANWSWKSLYIVVPILLFHELGHLVAMRWFGYRNTRMFFIPFFGAAVTGRNHNVPGWKKVVVSLMGPVPGILAGGAIGVVGLLTHKAWIMEGAVLSLVINGFNLLPLLPLDGGWVLHATLFCRHRYLDILFRGLAIIGIVGVAITLQDQYLAYVALPMLIGLPTAYRTAKIVDKLRVAGFPARATTADHLGGPLAAEIVREVKTTFPRATSAQNAAQVTLNVYETLNARPPGWLGTTALLGIHGMSFLAAAVFAMLLIVGQRGQLLGTLRMAAQRPQMPYARGTTLVTPVGPPAPAPAGARATVVANFADRAQAEAIYQELSRHLPPMGRLTLFGRTLLLSLPAENEKDCKAYSDEFRQQTKQVAVHKGNGAVACRLFGIAPQDDMARRLDDELRQYFAGAGIGASLIPPWSPAWEQSPHLKQWRKTRRTYERLTRAGEGFTHSPEATEIRRQVFEALKGREQAKVDELMKQQGGLHHQAQLRDFAALRAEGPEKVDMEVIDRYAEWRKTAQTKSTDSSSALKLPKAVIERMGLLPGGQPQPGEAKRPRFAWGQVEREGLLLTIRFVPAQIESDLPALAEWLYAKGCVDLTYDCVIGEAEDAEDDEPE